MKKILTYCLACMLTLCGTGLFAQSNMTTEEVKDFIRTEINAQLPADYKVPSYITAGETLEAVMETFRSRYPEFQTNGNSASLMEAVKQNPDKYKDYIRENKAIRNNYSGNRK